MVFMGCASTVEKNSSNRLKQFEMKQNISNDAARRLGVLFNAKGTYFPGAGLPNFKYNETMMFLNLEPSPLVKDLNPRETVKVKIAFQQDSLIETLETAVEYNIKLEDDKTPTRFEFVKLTYPKESIRIAAPSKKSK